MKNVYAKVVADLMHPGHVEFFRQARSLGDSLTVNVVPDERVALAKRRPILSTAERAQMVAACRYVDRVITDGPKVITLEFMQVNQFQIYAFGAVNNYELLGKLTDCVDLPDSMRIRLPYTDGVSTTQLINRILERRGL
jgi:cytidyltransferase-like protein